MTMIEKVALALFERDSPGIRYEVNDKLWFEEMARAAIEAMREPTEKMLVSAAVEIPIPDEDERSGVVLAANAWTAMIDAALKETQ